LISKLSSSNGIAALFFLFFLSIVLEPILVFLFGPTEEFKNKLEEKKQWQKKYELLSEYDCFQFLLFVGTFLACVL